MTIRSECELPSLSSLLRHRRLIPFRRTKSARNPATLRLALIGFALACFPALGLAQAGSSATTPTSQSELTRSVPVSAATSTPGNSNNASSASAVSAPIGYQLSASDLIAVEVFGEEDLRTAARLNSEGNVSLPLIGSVHLESLTLAQATTRVTELYARDYLVNPKVNVTLLGYAKRRFTVLGQVNRPGSYEMPETSPGGVDLLEAIAIAGGYTRIAAPERISVRRNDKLLKVDAKRLGRGQGNFRVESGDTITVGESIF